MPTAEELAATTAEAAAAKAIADKAAADKAVADKAAADAKAAEDKTKTFGGAKTAAELAAEKQAADDKAAADKAAADAAAKDGKGSKDGDSGQPKAPDTYTLTVPDDAKTALGDHLAGIQADLEADAKASGWSNEEAQAQLETRLETAADRLATLRESWLTQTTAHKTYGGANLIETQRLARQGVDGIFPKGHEMRDSFISLLNGSGLGNRLEVVAFLATLGKLMGEDTGTLGALGARAPEVKKTEEVLFTHPTSVAKA